MRAVTDVLPGNLGRAQHVEVLRRRGCEAEGDSGAVSEDVLATRGLVPVAMESEQARRVVAVGAVGMRSDLAPRRRGVVEADTGRRVGAELPQVAEDRAAEIPEALQHDTRCDGRARHVAEPDHTVAGQAHQCRVQAGVVQERVVVDGEETTRERLGVPELCPGTHGGVHDVGQVQCGEERFLERRGRPTGKADRQGRAVGGCRAGRHARDGFGRHEALMGRRQIGGVVPGVVPEPLPGQSELPAAHLDRDPAIRESE